MLNLNSINEISALPITPNEFLDAVLSIHAIKVSSQLSSAPVPSVLYRNSVLRIDALDYPESSLDLHSAVSLFDATQHIVRFPMSTYNMKFGAIKIWRSIRASLEMYSEGWSMAFWR